MEDILNLKETELFGKEKEEFRNRKRKRTSEDLQKINVTSSSYYVWLKKNILNFWFNFKFSFILQKGSNK